MRSNAIQLRARAGSHCSGLTLVELLVVVFILAVLAQTAVLATESLAEQSQQDATVRSLEAVEAAVLGLPNRRDAVGQPLVGGFVADVGRLPQVWGSAVETGLQELWRRPTGPPADPVAIEPFAVQQPTGDPDVRLPAGWRGPYLRLGIGSSELSDGWNRAPTLLRGDGTAAQPLDPVEGIVSFGADGLPDPAVSPSGYDRDLRVVFTSTSASAPVPPRYRGSVVVFVRSLATATAATTATIRLYGPENGRVVTLQQSTIAIMAGEQVAVTFADVTIGPRIVRAYRAAAPPGMQDAFPDSPPTPRSDMVPIVVEVGGPPPIVLDLR